MSVFKNRRLLVGIASLVIVICAAAAIWGVPKFRKRSTSTKGQVTAFLLDDRGSVNGLLLATGDQLSFGPETGVLVASQIKVGDEVSATGHAGSQTTYGREIRVEQISANGNTILAVHGGPRRKHERDRHHESRDRGNRPAPNGPPQSAPVNKTQEEKASSGSTRPATTDPGTAQLENTSPATTPTPEMIKVTATIRAHLVNGRGDVDGLILSSGEQVRFAPKVGKLLVAAEQGPTTQVSIEGPVVRSKRGIVIRPTVISVGNQTIALEK